MAVMLPRENWPDQRLDDLNKKVDDGFARVDKKIDEGFVRLDKKIDERFGEVVGQLFTLQQLLIRAIIGGGVAMGVGFLGIIAATLWT